VRARVIGRLLPLLGLALLVWLLASVRLADLAAALLSADPAPLALASAAAIVPLCLNAARWRLILEPMGIVVGYREAFAATAKGTFLGELTPGKLGDFARVRLLAGAPGASFPGLLSSVAVDRAYDVVALCLFAIASLALDGEALAPEVGGRGLMAAGALLAAGVALLSAEGVARRALRPLVLFIARAGGPAVQGGVEQCLSSIGALRWRTHAASLALSASGWAARLLVMYLLARALGIDAPYASIFLAGTVGVLASLLPISFSGLGPREGAVVYFLGKAGVPAGSALALSLLYFAVGLLSVVLPACYFFLSSAAPGRARPRA
jgi:uncharacterized membrane protein YbhN (UPF0104 family)